MDFISVLQANNGAFAAVMFLLGLLIGSFLNVVIYRLPLILDREWRSQCAELTGQADDCAGEDITLASPRSHCPACKAPVRALHNVPLLSWLALRGRCASCGVRIPVRYPLVELATGIMSAAVAWHFGFGFEAACALVLTWFLVPLTGIDLDHQLLPDSMTLPLLWLGLLASLWSDPASASPLPVSPRDAIIGAVAAYVFLWGVFQAFKLLTGKEGMGFGDFKLFAALGAWLGWQMLPLILLLSAAVGASVGIGLIVFRRQGREAPIPYGPYLAGAGWIATMWGPQIVGGYLSLSGLR
jgi:leader peptidase (prepilin peptidase)/N-methyltransferase